jgi:hypothetical protein
MTEGFNKHDAKAAAVGRLGPELQKRLSGRGGCHPRNTGGMSPPPGPRSLTPEQVNLFRSIIAAAEQSRQLRARARLARNTFMMIRYLHGRRRRAQRSASDGGQHVQPDDGRGNGCGG